jgi:hypothetical protein
MERKLEKTGKMDGNVGIECCVVRGECLLLMTEDLKINSKCSKEVKWVQ